MATRQAARRDADVRHAANATSHVGSYAVTASGLTSSDYSIAYVAGTLTVTKAA